MCPLLGPKCCTEGAQTRFRTCTKRHRTSAPWNAGYAHHSYTPIVLSYDWHAALCVHVRGRQVIFVTRRRRRDEDSQVSQDAPLHTSRKPSARLQTVWATWLCIYVMPASFPQTSLLGRLLGPSSAMANRKLVRTHLHNTAIARAFSRASPPQS